jgi:hypothetical protein
MDAEISTVFFEGAMDFFSVFAVRQDSRFAKSCGGIQFNVFEQKPLVRVF